MRSLRRVCGDASSQRRKTGHSFPRLKPVAFSTRKPYELDTRSTTASRPQGNLKRSTTMSKYPSSALRRWGDIPESSYSQLCYQTVMEHSGHRTGMPLETTRYSLLELLCWKMQRRERFVLGRRRADIAGQCCGTSTPVRTHEGRRWHDKLIGPTSGRTRDAGYTYSANESSSTMRFWSVSFLSQRVE